MYTFFLIFFSIMAYHRILNIVPCAIGPCCLFIVYNSLYLLVPNFQSIPPPPPRQPVVYLLSKPIVLWTSLESSARRMRVFICLLTRQRWGWCLGHQLNLLNSGTYEMSPVQNSSSAVHFQPTMSSSVFLGFSVFEGVFWGRLLAVGRIEPLLCQPPPQNGLLHF